MDKPFSPACENNRDPILALLMPLLADKSSVLEIGSGTGQHAVWFAKICLSCAGKLAIFSTIMPALTSGSMLIHHPICWRL